MEARTCLCGYSNDPITTSRQGPAEDARQPEDNGGVNAPGSEGGHVPQGHKGSRADAEAAVGQAPAVEEVRPLFPPGRQGEGSSGEAEVNKGTHTSGSSLPQ